MSEPSMSFAVRLLRAGGAAVEEATLAAGSEAEVRALLQAQGAVVLGVRRLAKQLPRASAPSRAGGRFDVAWWCRELRTLLLAGMTVVEAIETLAADRHDGVRIRLHDALLKALHEGRSLSRAMAGTGAFPQVLVASVTASERTSTLPSALEDYLRYEELLRRLRQQLVSAAIYPAIVVGLGAAICTFLLVVVVPRFARMYAELHGPVTAATEMVLWISRTVQTSWPILLEGVVGLAMVAAALWRSGALGRGAARIVDAVPPLERQWRQFRLAKLYQAMALMIRGGFTFDEALQVGSGLGAGPDMARRLGLARTSIARGKAASAALSEAGMTDVLTERLLAVGERTGSFANILQVIADRHAQAFTTFVERATRIVEPLLLLLVALAVGSIVVLMYMPIFDIAGSLGVGG